MTNKYNVTYIEKYNREQHTSSMIVEAENAKEACKKCVELNVERTGRHAFHPKAVKLSDKDVKA